MKKLKSAKTTMRVDQIQLVLLALPGFLLTFVFCYLPMGGIILAFKNFNPNLGIFQSPWIGLDNFVFFFASNDFTRLMRNTVLYALWFLLVDNVCSIALALMFYNITKKSLLKVYQTSAILPSFMSIVLISYIVYAFLSPAAGLANQIIVFFGGKAVQWYSNPSYWPMILTVVRQWMGVGMGCLIYYATMVGIDEALFEAARIDGAKKWRQFYHIILPALAPLISLKLIMGSGALMSGDFGLFYQIPRNVGLLYETTDIFNTYTFRALQTGTSMGRTAAVGLFTSASGAILLVICNLIIRKIDPEKAMF